MASSVLDIFFDYAMTHMGKAELHELGLNNCSEKCIQMCSKFLEEKSIETVAINCRYYNTAAL